MIQRRVPTEDHDVVVIFPGVEAALARALRWAVGGALFSLPLLLIPQPTSSQLLQFTTVHLSALVVLGLLVTVDLVRLIDDSWFAWLRPTPRLIASGAAAVAVTMGVVALVTLPTSAALRLDASLQFLQLLSALDIAFAAGTTLIGVGWLAGRRWGRAAGLGVAIVCVWSIWTYLSVVGFAPDGGWQVDGGALMRYVLPYDMAAAVVAVVSLIMGARHVASTDPA